MKTEPIPKKARRIQDLNRMKARAIHAREAHPDPFEAIKSANHLKRCSCPMCCNARNNPWEKDGRTMAEIKAEDSAMDQLNDSVLSE